MRIDLAKNELAAVDAITEGVTVVPTKRRRKRPKTTRRAWSMVSQLEADGHSAETLSSLEAAKIIERWDRKDGQAVTLTPWGKYLREVELLERRAVVREEETDRDKDTGKRVRVIVEREDVEVYWGREDPDRPRPIRLATHRREFRMPYPELKPDPGPGPEYLVDSDDNPVKLFQGLFTGGGNLKGGLGDEPGGVKVEVDRRLEGAKTKKGQPKELAPACAVNLYDRPARGFTPEELGLNRKKA